MKIRPATNHSSEKIDYNQFFSQMTELFLPQRGKVCSLAYLGMPNST